MKTKQSKTKSRTKAGRTASLRCGRLVRRLMKLVTEDGKFAYGTPTRCLDVVEHVFAAHRRMCDNLQTCVQKHNLGLGGEPVDEIVIAALEKFMRFPPPVDNEFVAPGCEKFGTPSGGPPNALHELPPPCGSECNPDTHGG